MARIEEAILGRETSGHGFQSPMTDLKYGGQMGYSPVLGEWVSNAAYKRQHVIPILLQYPRAFDVLQNREYWISTLKALVEQHVRTIDGLNAGLNVETAGHPVGGGGQQQLEYTNVTETETSVVMSWEDKYGMAIGRFWRRYVTYLMMDPHSKVAAISTTPEGRRLEDWLPDMYSFSMLFMEPDPHHSRVVKSWVVSNLFPQGTGDIVGRRDITAALEFQPVDITFGGIAQFGPGVDEFAQSIMDRIDITAASPTNRKSFIQSIQEDISAANTGYRHTAEQTGRDSIRVTL